MKLLNLPAGPFAEFSLERCVLPFLLCMAAGYLLGSVNWAIILTRVFKDREDIRSYGSGNAGMTNVLRSVGKLPALLTFLGDFLKCVMAILLAWGVLVWFGCGAVEISVGKYLTGVACVLGHAFPLYYGFRGGKCIVVSSAMMLMTDWRVYLAILLTFGLMFLLRRIISLGSVICAAMYPVYTFLITFFLEYRRGGCSPEYLLFVVAVTFLVAVLVLWAHRKNIGRLLRGEEKPITSKKK